MSTITFDDFMKVDIRIGTIVEVEEFPEARKPAYKLKIDFGPEIGVKKSSAQITVHYTPETLKDRQVAAVVNFPPRQIGPFMSEVLTLGFADANGDIVLIGIDTTARGCRDLQEARRSEAPTKAIKRRGGAPSVNLRQQIRQPANGRPHGRAGGNQEARRSPLRQRKILRPAKSPAREQTQARRCLRKTIKRRGGERKLSDWENNQVGILISARNPPSIEGDSVMSPPWLCAMSRAIAMPRPVPPESWLRAWSSRTNGLNTSAVALRRNARAVIIHHHAQISYRHAAR
jgi:tRNA-binding protein